MINIEPNNLIVEATRGHAKRWFMTSWMNNYLSWPEENRPFSEADVRGALSRMYDQGFQTPANYHKLGRRINLDRVYVTGVDTSFYPQIDWWLSYE